MRIDPSSMLPILQRMTAYDSTNRFQSASEVLEALELSRAPDAFKRKPGRRMILITGLILMMLMAGFVFEERLR